MVRGGKLAACAGVVGLVLFTGWVVSSLRQAGHPAAGVQLSGLAAEDARDPQLMMATFVVPGACPIGFGAALRKVAGLRGGRAVTGHGVSFAVSGRPEPGAGSGPPRRVPSRCPQPSTTPCVSLAWRARAYRPCSRCR